MIWIIIIYVLGCIASAALIAWVLKEQIDSTGEIMLDDVIIGICSIIGSWVFVIGVFVTGGIMVVLEKAKKIKVYERKKEEDEERH